MNNRIYIATFSDSAIEEIRENNLNIEINHLCISQDLDDERVGQTIESIKGDMAASKASRAIAHGPFTEIIPASIDHIMVEAGMKRLQQAYKVCKEVGINKMVVHSGHMPLLYFDSWHVEKSVEFWKDFLKDKEGFTIYVENVFEDSPDTLLEIANGVNDPKLKICLDIGHANAMTSSDYTVYDWIEKLGRYIGHFHIHNNDGTADQHRELGDGMLDMAKIFYAVKENCEDDVTFTIESRNCRESIMWLKDNGYL